jgi:hypothetical protein
MTQMTQISTDIGDICVICGLTFYRDSLGGMVRNWPISDMAGIRANGRYREMNDFGWTTGMGATLPYGLDVAKVEADSHGGNATKCLRRESALVRGCPCPSVSL